jgi:FG-GAP repeat protein
VAHGLRRVLTLLFTWVMLAGMTPAQSHPARATGGVTAMDVSVQAGVYEVTKTWSASVGDLDGDGWPDFSLSRHGGTRLACTAMTDRVTSPIPTRG